MKKIFLLSLLGCLLASAVKAQNTPAFDGRQMIDVAKVTAWNFASRPAGWYRIAKTSMRGNATFELREDANHGTLRFEIGISYNYNGGSSLTITSHSTYTAPVFTKLRLLTQNVYGDAYLEVYVDPHNNDNSIFNAYMINPMANGDWSLLNWETGSVPMGYSVAEFDADQLFLVGNAVKGSVFSINRNGLVGIGTTSPSEKLSVYGTTNAAPGVLALESYRNDQGYAEVGSIRARNGGDEIARIGMQRGNEMYSGLLNFFVKASNSSPVKEALRIAENGNVGVGTTNPTERLSVDGNINISNSTGGKYLGFGVANNDEYNTIGSMYSSAGLVLAHGLKPQTSANGLAYSFPNMARSAIVLSENFNYGGIKFYIKGQSAETVGNAFVADPVMQLTDAGNLLIGKTSQNNAIYKLDVAGKARVNEIVVNTNGADFVFEDKYKLKPLAEVEQFIKQYKHLPEIPNAQTMQKEGVGVSELQTKLLQKIEELTLHLIEKDKELSKEKEINKVQNERLKEVEAKQNELEALLKKLVANK